MLEQIIGRRIVSPVRPALPAHFIRCPACHHLLEMRRLEDVLAHEKNA